MSEQHVLAFVNKVNKDKALQAKMHALPGDTAALVKFAGESGFSFSVEEWQAVAASSFGELTDGDLDAVTGGGGGTTPLGIPCSTRPVGPVSIPCNLKPPTTQSLFKKFG